uniref:MBD domain-containing protein n=1 Tax=Callorhinchus milii TaxID=7868 RepID=A0A4W3JTL2_CALMI
MNGGKECSGSDQGGGSLAAQVPVGWERRVDQERVAYISPSGTVLSSVQQVRAYLLTEGACKCGLECPLILHKVFSFDPGANVKRRTAEDVKADEDVMKLCNHKRKIIAMATLHKSMETTHSSLALSSPTLVLTVFFWCARVWVWVGSHSLSPEYKNIFLSKLMGAPNSLGRPFQPASSPNHDPHSGYPRQRHGSSDHRQTSPCSRHRGDPTSPVSAGTTLPTASALSPHLESKGRCETFARTYSPFNPELHSGSVHLHQNPLMAVGLPQKSQALLSRGMISPPPPPPAPLPRSPKSPLVKNSCGFASNADVAASVFQKRSPGPVTSLQNPKDPLGILDLICDGLEPTGGGCSTAPAAQPSQHSQVAALNVNVPPLLSHLPSLAGSTAHGSPHPESSLAQVVGGVKRAPQRSRPSSTSSDQEGYTLTGQQSRCSTPKSHSRSPRSLNSPRPSLPPSPKAKVDGFFQQYKELSGPLFATAGNAASHQSLPLHLPAPTDNVPQPMKPPGLLGMPLNEIFSQQHNAAFFPASSLLSAAAKAQLASQNKMAAGGGYNATATGNHRTPEIQSTLPNHFSPAPNRLLPMADPPCGPQRDKAAAQHKDLSKKRKTATPTVLSMLKQSQTNLSNGSKLEADILRNQWPNLSLVNQPMSQLLHSLSAQSSQANSNNSTCHINSVSFPSCTNNQFNIVASNLNPSPVQNLPVVNVPVGSVGETTSSQSLSTNLLSSYQEANSHLLGLVGQLALCSPGPSSGSAPVLKIPASTLLMLPHSSGSSSASQSVSVSIAGKGHPAITKTTSVLNPGVIVTTTVDGSLPGPLPLADAFAFINQDQVLPFGHSTSPSGGQSNPLNPNLLSSLPISLPMNQQPTLNQNPLQLVPTAVEGQGDGMLNLLGLLNPTLNPNQQPLLQALQGPLGIQMFQSQLPIPGPIHHTNPLSCLFHNVQVSGSSTSPSSSRIFSLTGHYYNNNIIIPASDIAPYHVF